MKETVILLISLMLVLSIFIGGCTQKQSPAVPAPTAVITSMQTPPVTTTQACSLVPGPTQIVPSYESVSVTVDRNSITENPTITVTFNGGLGNGMVTLMNVTVVRSDCITENGARNNPDMGESVTLMGTTKTDRVIVVMTFTSGDQYTIIDGLYPFPR